MDRVGINPSMSNNKDSTFQVQRRNSIHQLLVFEDIDANNDNKFQRRKSIHDLAIDATEEENDEPPRGFSKFCPIDYNFYI